MLDDQNAEEVIGLPFHSGAGSGALHLSLFGFNGEPSPHHMHMAIDIISCVNVMMIWHLMHIKLGLHGHKKGSREVRWLLQMQEW